MDLNTLIAECTAYDYKEMLEENKPKSWLKSVSAFSNGLGGSLFYGVNNDGVVKGLDDVQHVCEAISSKIREFMDPLPDVEMIPHEVDGHHVLQVKVNAGKVVRCIWTSMMTELLSLLLAACIAVRKFKT